MEPDKAIPHYKQIIVARLDLSMSEGKFAAQTSHASMAFLTNMLQKNFHYLNKRTVRVQVDIDYELWEGWLNGTFTKVILGVKDKNDMDRLIANAQDHGFERDRDFFCIYDNCLTELIAEEPDGTCLTCVGFRPMPNEQIDPVTKRIRLYTGRNPLR